MRLCLLILGLFITVVAFGDDERFSRITPTVVQRGGEHTLLLAGDKIGDAAELMVYDEGIEPLSVAPAMVNHPKNEKDADGKVKKVPSDKQVEAKIKVPADCRLGKHRLRLRTETGQSEVRNLLVVNVPTVAEERNNSLTEPQMVELGTAVYGRIDREDVDYFGVDLKKGQRLTAEVFGTMLGNSQGDNYFDPYIGVINEAGFEIALRDDHPHTGNDAFVSFRAPADGRYIVAVRDAAYNGDGNAFYVVQIDDTPRPVAALPPGGQFGQTLDVTFQIANDLRGEDEPIETITQSVTLPTEDELATLTQPFGVHLKTENGLSAASFPMIVSAAPAVAEVEPNDHEVNEPTPANLQDGRIAMHGVIDKLDDEDNFLVELRKNQSVDIRVYASSIGSPLDPVLNVYQVTPKFKYDKGADDTGRNYDATLAYRAPETGTYAFRVRDHRGRFGPDYVYRMEITPREKSLTGEPVEINRYVQERLSIPQGGGFGIQASIRRSGVSGKVTIDGVDLPEGVRVVSPENWDTNSRVPVVLYADEDAPLAARWSTLRLTHQPLDKEGKPAGEPVIGQMNQRQLMVRWRNNDRVVEEDLTRLPVVVRKPVGFDIEIEKPTVPIVPGAYLPLTINLNRHEGFNGEVRMQMVMDPTGCSSSRSAKFTKDQTSVTVNLTASDKAAIGTYDISMQGRVGTDYNASPFVPVTVAERMLDFKWQQAAAEQGTETAVIAKITHNTEWTGTATVELKGLPPHTSSVPQTITPDQDEVVFPVTVGKETPASTHKSLYAIVNVPYGDAPADSKPAEEVATVAVAETPADPDEQEPAKDEPEAKGKADAPKADAKPEEAAKTEEAAKAEPPKDTRPTVLHQLRGGVLRVDKPLPPKKNAKPAPKKVEKKPAAPKPLSRLEQLRKAKADAE